MPSLRSAAAIIAALAMTVTAAPSPHSDESHERRGRVEVQGHRGGLGMRSEESLWAFAYAMEVGVDTLEMDTVFTFDGIPVIWHDHKILDTKCSGAYVGQFIANLTLAQVKTLDCTKQLAAHPQAELHPLTRIATLEEVLDLVNCYGDRKVTINLETKLDPEAPAETLPLERYIDDIVPILQKKGFGKRTFIQSFDWRTLVGIKAKFPEIPTVALLDPTTIVPNAAGKFAWLNNIKLDTDFGGDWIKAAASIGASVLSPVHGYGGATVNTPGYVPFVTKDVVDRAHKAGMTVIPWTVDHEVTIAKLINDGVDGIISNYPERVIWVAKQKGISSGKSRNPARAQCLANAAKGL